MGQAKRRGTFEERVDQAVARRAEESRAWMVKYTEAKKREQEELQRRIDAGEVLPPASFPRRRRSPVVEAAILAALLVNR